jgi:hypothetical protein
LAKARKPALASGDLVAMQLRPGVFGLIWIISASAEFGFEMLVMDGYWPTLPTSNDLRGAQPAPSQRFDLLPEYRDVWKAWFGGRVPADFHVVGNRAPSAKEKGYIEIHIGKMNYETAETLRHELHQSWRLKHDRKAIEAERAAADAQRKERATPRRRKLALEKMLRERIFASWTRIWPPHVVREARRIFRDATKELIALDRRGTKRERDKVLKRITSEFNALYDKEGCIETDEREEIVARVEDLAHLVGTTNADERLTGHRDW